MSKTALITGASGGIGYELALLFARDQYDCVLVARSRDKLDELAARLESEFRVKTLVVAKDLSKPSTVDEIYEEVTAASLKVDALVNNAGFPVYGRFVETDLQAELEMLQVNVVALTALTKLFLRGMVERGTGHVLNLASTAAFVPGPLMAVYYASKAYVLSFSEALANELKGTGVTVTALAPGPTRSGFQERGKLEDARLVRGSLADAASVALALPLLSALLGAKFGNVLLWGIVGAAAGFFAPDIFIARKGKERQAEIRRALPETLDLLAIAVGAGMGLEAAIDLVIQRLPGALCEEFHRLLQELALGVSRREALANLRDRTEVDELSTFALILTQADALGSPLGSVLKAQAAEMRALRRQRAGMLRPVPEPEVE